MADQFLMSEEFARETAEMLRWWRRNRHQLAMTQAMAYREGPEEESARDYGTIRIVNNTGLDWYKTNVVGIGESITDLIGDTDAEWHEFVREPTFYAVQPSAATPFDGLKRAVLIEDIPKGASGLAVHSGVVAAQVYLESADHKRVLAETSGGNVWTFRSSNVGEYDLVWKPTVTSYPATKYCYVRLPGETPLLGGAAQIPLSVTFSSGESSTYEKQLLSSGLSSQGYNLYKISTKVGDNNRFVPDYKASYLVNVSMRWNPGEDTTSDSYDADGAIYFKRLRSGVTKYHIPCLNQTQTSMHWEKLVYDVALPPGGVVYRNKYAIPPEVRSHASFIVEVLPTDEYWFTAYRSRAALHTDAFECYVTMTEIAAVPESHNTLYDNNLETTWTT